MQQRAPLRTYDNHHINSTRWDSFQPRPDDIVIATPAKAGTTWTQAIVGNLLFPDGVPGLLSDVSIWLDHPGKPLDDVLAELEAQKHRRFVKSHVPADGLPLYPQTKYIAVGRDGRDIFMSLWNHYRNYSDSALERMKARAEEMGEEFPVAPDNINTFWRNLCTRGWFAWETDGWPFWSQLHVMQSWFDLRQEPNVLLLHYGDMLADTAGAVRQVADFLEIKVAPTRVEAVADEVAFDSMKEKSSTYVPHGGTAWKEGADTFFNKGTNGRWQSEITPENLTLYDEAAARALTPVCRAWVEH